MSLQLTNVLDELVAQKKAAALRDEMEKPVEERRKTEDVFAEVMEDWLFTTPKIIPKSKAATRKRSKEAKSRGGTRLDPSNLRKVFWSTLTKAELRRIRFHDLRHTFASLLLQQGESPAYVKDQLGHHSIQITVDIYGHLVPGGNRRAVDRLMNDVENAKPQEETETTGHKTVTVVLERGADYV